MLYNIGYEKNPPGNTGLHVVELRKDLNTILLRVS